jgi:Tfp pilus assembly protein PilX
LFFQAIVPFVKEIWKDRCIDRNTLVVGRRIVAEYDSLTKKVTHTPVYIERNGSTTRG